MAAHDWSITRLEVPEYDTFFPSRRSPTPARPRRPISSTFVRALQVLEAIAHAERPLAVADLVRELRLPKATAHRLVATLERCGLVHRDPLAKRLIVGARLAALALDVVLQSTQHGPRHQILMRLTAETLETSTFTMLERGELLLVDRVESAWPLRVNLFPGSRVPLHCTASGKLMLAMMPDAKRERLLRAMLPLRGYTANTITDPKKIAKALQRIRSEQVSTDREEFMTGMVAIAVPVLHPSGGKSIGTVSLNAPAARLTINLARRHLPALRRAAHALSAAFQREPKLRTAERTLRKS